jgi:hypothetical protein
MTILLFSAHTIRMLLFICLLIIQIVNTKRINFSLYSESNCFKTFFFKFLEAVKDLTLASNLNQAALSLARTRGTLGQSNTAPDEIYSTLKTIPAPKEESELQRRLAEENAKFNEYQTNKWKNVQERLDSVYVAFF